MKATTFIATAVLAASTVASTAALAELSGNVGLSSNYIWRGVTQTLDDSAISGGIDYANDSGFYAGTWVSSLGPIVQYEQDWYAGYGFKAGTVDLDAGYIAYTYPVGSVNADFSEVYLNASYQNFGAGLAYTVSSDDDTTPEFSKGDLYLFVSADFEVKKDLNLGVLIGDYDFDDPTGADYTHYQLSLSKGDFSFAYDKNDLTGIAGDARFTVSYSKNFDL